MSTTSWMARRYLQAGRNNKFFSWVSALTVAGVAVGVAAMIVVWSVINGFEIELRKRFLTANSHIMAYRYPHGIENAEKWASMIERDFKLDVKGVAPFVWHETLARNQSILHSVLIRGTDPRQREKVQSLAFVVEPQGALDIVQKESDNGRKTPRIPAVPAIIVGSGLLSLLDAKIGDVVELVEPERNELAKMKKFKIVGTYDSGLKHYDNKLVIMALPTAQKFFDMGKLVTGLEIGLEKPYESPRVAAEMSERYSLQIKEWLSLNRPLFEAMKTERVVILLITALVACVAGFNILTTIFVAVSQRQRDISILKALGASNPFVFKVFVKQAVFVGVVGSLIGCALAVLISALLERYQFIDLPDLYLLAKLPMTYDWRVYLSVSIASVAIAVIAGFLPGWIACRVDPVEGFRGTEGMD